MYQEDYQCIIGIIIFTIIIAVMLIGTKDDIPKLDNGTPLYEVIDY